MSRIKDFWYKTSNLHMLLFICILFIVGIGFLFFSNIGFVQQYVFLTNFLNQLASLFILTAVATTFWEFIGKRSFADEVLEKANISKEVFLSGIIKFSDSFHGGTNDFDWKEFFENTNVITLFFSYARTWRGVHLEDLRQFTNRTATKIRVILPNPENPDILKELARKYSKTSEEIGLRINEAIEYFKELKRPMADNDRVEIWILDDTPTFTFYLSDKIAIVALYTHRKLQVPVPTYVCKKEGSMYKYIKEEVASMIESGTPLARKIN